MGTENADVKIRLVVDDAATKNAAEGVKEELKDVADHTKKAHDHQENLGKELLKAEIYTHLITEGAKLVAEGFHQAWEMGEKLADAAMEATDEMNQQTRAMSGLMSFMDGGAHSMQELRGYAQDVREELAQSGTQAGVSTSKMTEMYDAVIERGGRSTEEAKELVEQMDLVGKVVPRGMEGLAEGFNMMELGIVRARNPLVQLIASTHLLKGNAHDIARAMQHMTPAQQIELAQKAIAAQATMLKGGTGLGAPTLEELKASFGNIREGFLEAVGQPLLDRIVPNLSKLRDYLSSHSEEISKYGEEVGDRIGAVIERVEDLAAQVYSGAVRDWSLIKGEFDGIEEEWNNMWHLAVGDSATVSRDFKDAALTFAKAIHEAMKYVTATIETIQNLKDFFGADNAAEGAKHWGEGVARARTGAAAEEVQGQAATGTQEDFDKAIDKYVAWAKKAGASADDIDAYVEAQRAYHDAEARDLATFKDKVESSDVDGLASQIQKARDVQDDAWLGSALNYIGESDAMTKALMDGSIHVQGGFDTLKEIIERSAPELAERIKKMQREAFGPKGIAGHGPTMNFYGGVHIKQDFRDQDPDRIMTMFRADLARQAVNRRQARTGLFGGL